MRAVKRSPRPVIDSQLHGDSRGNVRTGLSRRLRAVAKRIEESIKRGNLYAIGSNKTAARESSGEERTARFPAAVSSPDFSLSSRLNQVPDEKKRVD